VQALFDGAVLRLPCVIGDRGGQAAGPVTSAFPGGLNRLTQHFILNGKDRCVR
jgi:hypothetical protein